MHICICVYIYMYTYVRMYTYMFIHLHIPNHYASIFHHLGIEGAAKVSLEVF